MKKVKIYGAGSIGNHLSRAFRTIGYEVFVCDTDKAALERMKNEIYPSRYGAWDDNIKLFINEDMPKQKYDFVVIGTPPESHTSIALKCLDDGDTNILIEKPLTFPDDPNLELLKKKIEETESFVFVGYNHVVSKSIKHLEKIIKSKEFGEVLSIDVEFRENWDGIFKAHPWLDGPKDSYLGFIKKGGGSLCEHSHALNLWQHLATKCFLGEISDFHAFFKINKNNSLNYDEFVTINLQTQKNIVGRVIQDVVTKPHSKMAKLICEKGVIEWTCNYNGNSDLIKIINLKNEVTKIDFTKTREQDFLEEVQYISSCLENKMRKNDISFENGFKTMELIDRCISKSSLL